MSPMNCLTSSELSNPFHTTANRCHVWPGPPMPHTLQAMVLRASVIWSQTQELFWILFFKMSTEFNIKDYAIFLPIFNKETLCCHSSLLVLWDFLPPSTLWGWTLPYSSSLLIFSEWTGPDCLPWGGHRTNERAVPRPCETQQLLEFRVHSGAQETAGWGPCSVSFYPRHQKAHVPSILFH